MRISNLPPGVTDQDIERQANGDNLVSDEFCCPDCGELNADCLVFLGMDETYGIDDTGRIECQTCGALFTIGD